MPRPCVAVVGASAGLGAALACLHADAGSRVVAVARRRERLAELAALPLAGEIHPLAMDLADPTAAAELASAILTSGAAQSVWMCAARPDPATPCPDPEAYLSGALSAWIRLHDTLVSLRALNSESRVVVISSLAAAVPFEGLELYSTAKAGLEAWARAARRRTAHEIVIVRPGPFQSEFYGCRPKLRFSELPWSRALALMRAVEQGQRDVVLGGWRDKLVSRAASLVGPERARRVLDWSVPAKDRR